MGLPIGRIEKEFVLNNLMDKQLPLKFHGNKEQLSGTLLAVTEEDLTLKLETLPVSKENSDVRIFFSYYGHIMTFRTKLLKKDKETVTVRNPRVIVKNLQRKYERVPCPKEVKVSFSIQDTKIELDFPKTEEYNPADAVEYSLTFDPTSIEQLINDFKQQAKSYAAENRIIMFRERTPEMYEEELIIKTGKILYIPLSKRNIPEEHSSFGGRVISKDFIHGLEDKREREELFSNLEKIMIRRNNEGIHAFLYCPLIYHEYVVGYVALLNREENKNPIEPEAIEFVQQFSQVLVYSLKINGYFKGGKPVTSIVEPEVIDISASGLLFSHSDKRLKELIMLYTDLDLTITLGHRKTKVASRVMRKYSDRHSTYFGVVFLTIQPEDFRFLFDYVYGRPFNPEEDALWEGGAEPPKIKLE